MPSCERDPEPVFWTDTATTCASLAHGDGVDAHFHDFGQLRYAASGVLVTTTDLGTWMAPGSRMMWVPPFAVHSSRSHGQTDISVVTVPEPFAARLPAEPSVIVASPLVREAYLAIADVDESEDRARHRLLLDLVTTDLARAPLDTLRLPAPRDGRLRAVTELLHSAPDDSATLSQLGRRIGASERTLSRLFSSELSMGFHQWRTLLRVQHALVLLADGASVTDTAVRLGWANPSSFIEAFTALVGQTPGRYRAAARSDGGAPGG